MPVEEFQHKRVTYVPPYAVILAENDLFVYYASGGIRILQDRFKDMHEISSEFHFRMLLKLLKIEKVGKHD